MRTAAIAATFCFVATLCSAAGPGVPSLGEKRREQGEILAIDRAGLTLTIRIATPDERETYVYHVTDRTVIRRKGSSEPASLADLKVAETVRVRSQRVDGVLTAVEVVVKRARHRKEKNP